MASASEETIVPTEEPTTSTTEATTAAAATVETDITIKCSSEYPDYSYNSSHDIWTLVSLKAPCQVHTFFCNKKVKTLLKLNISVILSITLFIL